MRVEQGTVKDIINIDELIDNSFNGTCFSYSWFLELKSSNTILKIYDEENNLQGFMPIFNSGLKDVIFQSTMYIPYGGPVIFDVPKEERNKIRYIRKIEKTISDYIIKNYKKADFSIDDKIIDIMPFIRSGFIPEVRYTYKIDLSKSLDRIYSEFGSDRKKDIRRAQTRKIKLFLDNKLEYFSSEEAMKWEKNYGVNNTKEFTKKYILESIKNNRGMAFVALNEQNEVEGAVHIAWDSNSAYILYSYYTNKKDDVAIAYLYYKIIEYLKDNNITKYLDFEGSVFEEIENWNISFGAYQSRFYNLHLDEKLNIKDLYNYGNK